LRARTAPKCELATKTTIEKGHGRIETRIYSASSNAGWIGADKSYPGQPRSKHINTLVNAVNRTEYADRRTFDARLYISSAQLDIERLAGGSRGHWGVESMQWLLDVEFRMICRVTEAVTEPKIWPPCAALPSASSEPTEPRAASKQKENQQDGTLDTFSKSCRSNER
jgi:hypothetical protein